jgi:N-carbamoyl-L-amino-acid hydrolase
MLAIISEIEARRHVSFELGRARSAKRRHGRPRDRVARCSRRRTAWHRGTPLGSPASHDAAAFAAAGVPVGMIFVRNEHGSHNPREAMEIDDFLAACTILADWVAREVA